MDLIEIINNFLNPQKIEISLSNETISELMKISELHKIGNNVHYLHGFFPPYDDFLFNPYFQMIICILAIWSLQDMFDILIWPDIKFYRDKFYRWLWCSIKRNTRFLKKK